MKVMSKIGKLRENLKLNKLLFYVKITINDY